MAEVSASSSEGAGSHLTFAIEDFELYRVFGFLGLFERVHTVHYDGVFKFVHSRIAGAGWCRTFAVEGVEVYRISGLRGLFECPHTLHCRWEFSTAR